MKTIKRLFCFLVLTSSIYGQTYVGSVTSVPPYYATKYEMLTADSYLQTQIYAFAATSGLTKASADLYYVGIYWTNNIVTLEDYDTSNTTYRTDISNRVVVLEDYDTSNTTYRTDISNRVRNVENSTNMWNDVTNKASKVTVNGIEYHSTNGSIVVTERLAEVNGANVSNFQAHTILFNTEVTHDHVAGQVGWNVDDGTIEVGMPGGNVTMQLGFESLIRTKAVGATISNGWVAFQAGWSGNRPTIAVTNGGHAPLGIATEDINSSNGGYVTLRGFVRDVNTASFSVNDELYASTNGPPVNTRPSYPNEPFYVGRVAKSHATEGLILAQTPSSHKTWAELDAQYKATTNNTTVASSTNTAKFLYVETASNSTLYVSMKTNSSSYGWVEILRSEW